MISHIINDCSKLSQKEYKTRYDCVWKVIHWELCKKLQFEHTTKWYLLKPESILENETQKNSKELWYTNRSPHPSQQIRPRNN